MRRYSLWLGVFLFCSLASALVFLKSDASMLAYNGTPMNAADIFCYFYGFAPNHSVIKFDPLLFGALFLPFVFGILLTALSISRWVLPLRHFTLPRYGEKRRWLLPQLWENLLMQTVFFLLLNPLLYLAFGLAWGFEGPSLYHQTYFPEAFSLWTAIVWLAFRQLALMLALTTAQIYFSVRWEGQTATLLALLFVLGNLFAAYLGLWTPFHLLVNGTTLLQPRVNLWLFLIALFLSAAVFAFVWLATKKLEFSKGEVKQ